MKKILKTIVTQILVSRAKWFLKKHRTQVIAVTGSVGKTSTKQAIYTVLKNHFKVYASPEGFNTEIGLSLAVLQEEKSGFSSLFGWLKILRRVFAGKQKPYQKIILEMGADMPGDIKKLVKIARPAIGVITRVAPVHLAEGQFKDITEISKEKSELVRYLPPTGVAVLNEDDPLIRLMETAAQKITYGTESSADLQASDIQPTGKQLKFTVHYQGEKKLFNVPVLGAFQIYVLLPAIAVGLKLGLTLKQCAEALADFCLPPGRMNPIEGVNKSQIIDSSYNASPVTVFAALALLEEIGAERKIAALGTMNELGEMSRDAHMDVAKQAAKVTDLLIAVGPEASTLKKGAMDAGMPEDRVYTFFDSEEAGNFLKSQLRPKDLVLVKGSQNRVRMEKLTKMIMAHPDQASTLLCRQEKEWESV